MKLINSSLSNIDLSDITSVVAGTGLNGGGTSGAITLNVDVAQTEITSLGTLTGLTIDGDKDVTPGDGAMLHIDTSNVRDTATSASGTASLYTHARIEGPTLAATNASVTTTDAATLYVLRPQAGTNQTITNGWGVYSNGATHTSGLTNISSYTQTAGDMTLYDATNGGDPTFSIGSSATERLEIKANYESGAQGLDSVSFRTFTAGSATSDGRFIFYVDEVNTFQIKDSLINIMESGKLTIGNVDILSDSSGTTTLNNIDALDATTEATIESAVDTLSNLTTVGTIGTGVWQGTAIATDQQKHLAYFSLTGYSVANGSTYESGQTMNDNNAPFEKDTDYGSDGLNNSTVANMIRRVGRVMPRAGAVKLWKGWTVASNAGADCDLGLFKFDPTANNSSQVAPTLIDNVNYTSLGNNKLIEVSEASFTSSSFNAGDIIYTAYKSDETATGYWQTTIEVEWT